MNLGLNTTILLVSSPSVPVNSIVNFECSTDGYPKPSFTWFKNGIQIMETFTSNLYSIINANTSDTGSYQCKATNTYGTQTSSSFDLMVWGKYIFSFPQGSIFGFLSQ